MRPFPKPFLILGLLAACGAPPIAPDPPDVVVTERTHVTITPKGPSTSQTGIGVRYELRRGAKAGGPWAPVTTVVVGKPVEEDAAAGAELSYVVVAVGEGGESPSPETVAYTVPGKPLNLRFSEVRSDGVTLAWDGARGVASWTALYSQRPGQAAAGQFIGRLPGLKEPQIRLSVGAAGYLVVQATNAAGESVLSDELKYDPSELSPTVVDPPSQLRVRAGRVGVRASWVLPSVVPSKLRLYLDGALTEEIDGTTTSYDLDHVAEDSAHTLAISAVGPNGSESVKTDALPFRTRTFTHLVGRSTHFCALEKAGRIWCWGGNGDAQLGVGASGLIHQIARPLLENGGTPVETAEAADVAVGVNFTCAAFKDRTLACWGANDQGQLGDGLAPTGRGLGAGVLTADGTTLSNVRQIVAGSTHACALRPNGEIWCWGDNTGGKLGQGDSFTATSSARAVRVVGAGGTGFLGPMEQISAGEYNTCARGADGAVWCWGAQLVERTETGGVVMAKHAAPVRKEANGTAVLASEIFNGAQSTCVSTPASQHQCWGLYTDVPGNGGPGSGVLGPTSIVEPLATLDGDGQALGPVSSSSWSLQQTCAVNARAQAWCWGDNARSLAGADVQRRPVLLTDGSAEGLGAVSLVAAGAGTTCVVDAFGLLRCWGRNDLEQCGNDAQPRWDSAVDLVMAGP